MNNAEQIEKLLKLKESGALTEEEFQLEKQRILKVSEPEKPQKDIKEIKKKGPNGCLVSIVVVFGLFLLGSIINGVTGDNTDNTQTVEEKKEESEASKLMFSPWELIEVKDFNWHLGGFGTVGIIDKIQITNNSTVPVKDITVKVTFSAPSGTELGSVQQTVYEVIPSKQTKILRNINIGIVPSQSEKAYAIISRAKSVTE